MHSEIAVEGAHAADGLRAIVIPGPSLACALQARDRQERLQMLLYGHGSGARAASTMRRRKRLVQIEVHDVDAEIARTRDAHQRVHVGAVHVEHARPSSAGSQRCA